MMPPYDQKAVASAAPPALGLSVVGGWCRPRLPVGPPAAAAVRSCARLVVVVSGCVVVAPSLKWPGR